MVKVKQKVAGLHRSAKGAKQFCRIQGYFSTMTKNNINILEATKSIFLGTSIMPQNLENKLKNYLLFF